MIRINKGLNKTLFLSILLVFLIAGCELSLDFLYDEIGATPVIIARDSFLLGWEAEDPDIPDLPSALHHFNIYTRELHSKRWILLKETAGFKLMTTLSVVEMGGYGSYELGIAEVLNNGTVEEIHSSMDFDARPAGGWYLIATEP